VGETTVGEAAVREGLVGRMSVGKAVVEETAVGPAR
jgi:hypothetical protein